ncbi:MAG: ABC transporter ATP-binding protein [Dethiobacter sp.]|jgi:branched-chain amino acid transport system ATP-binding protein|nr:ABC transporter ATP-binding protein [Dethiobacter sp.]
MLELKKVSKAFDGLKAVKEVSLEVEADRITGLIGPNGAGKTTIFNLVTNLYKLDQGEIVFNSKIINGLAPERICEMGISRTFQLVKTFNNLSVEKNVVIAALLRNTRMNDAYEKAGEVLNFLNLYHHRDKYAKNLNLCERKRLEVARALATDPKLLLLDEVMCGLNPTEIKDVMKTIVNINKTGVGIFLIEHIMSAVMHLSEKIIVLNHGEKLAEGSSMEISKNPEVVKAYLGEEYSLVES